MIMNEHVGALIEANPEIAAALANLMPVPVIEAIDISKRHRLAGLRRGPLRHGRHPARRRRLLRQVGEREAQPALTLGMISSARVFMSARVFSVGTSRNGGHNRGMSSPASL